MYYICDTNKQILTIQKFRSHVTNSINSNASSTLRITDPITYSHDCGSSKVFTKGKKKKTETRENDRGDKVLRKTERQTDRL